MSRIVRILYLIFSGIYAFVLGLLYFCICPLDGYQEVFNAIFILLWILILYLLIVIIINHKSSKTFDIILLSSAIVYFIIFLRGICDTYLIHIYSVIFNTNIINNIGFNPFYFVYNMPFLLVINLLILYSGLILLYNHSVKKAH